MISSFVRRLTFDIWRVIKTMTYYFEAGGNVKRDIINVRSIKILCPSGGAVVCCVSHFSRVTDIYILLGSGLFYDI